ncbi:MAG TPA: hypothetical protein V6C86_10015 [Oculatellaceae cyanobacterium]
MTRAARVEAYTPGRQEAKQPGMVTLRDDLTKAAVNGLSVVTCKKSSERVNPTGKT